MSIIFFIIILSALVIVHEFGHLLVAKKFGIRVDEFGLGFPPLAKKLFTWRETLFTLNWLPFGGFVKIFGENPASSEPIFDEAGGAFSSVSIAQDNFQSKNRAIQSAVLVGGVLGNFIFAWFLFTVGFVVGLPAPAGLSVPVENPVTMITLVMPDTPAVEAGLKSGDTLISLTRGKEKLPLFPGKALTPEEVINFIALSLDPIVFGVERGGQISEKLVKPKEGIVADRPAVGISMDVIGIAQFSPPQALWYGFKTTLELTRQTGEGLLTFFSQIFIGQADLTSVTGPVGIIGLVGDARELGFVYLLTFTALISINLAVINLLPLPALDGGRLFFVFIESIIRRPVSPKLFNMVNTVGFVLLILLMIFITIHDIGNIF